MRYGGYAPPCSTVRRVPEGSRERQCNLLAFGPRAGHSDFKTTQGYIDLAGETFREEADRLERRLWGGSSTKNRYQVAADETEAVPTA